MGTRSKGSEGEELAAGFLLQKGYRIVERNYRFERAEIDLIARDGDELVFVEVKTRYSERYGTPEESVTPSKVEQLKKAAEGYLHEHQISHQLCRFDVVAIRFVNGKPQIRLIQSAFV
jgi:putative endonuclease